MVEGTKGSHHKEGSKKMSKNSTVCAGIDTGKYKLDVAIDESADQLQVDNSPAGYRCLSAWLRQREVERIGIEASGGYEQAVVSFLRADGFVVHCLPTGAGARLRQVRAATCQERQPRCGPDRPLHGRSQ